MINVMRWFCCLSLVVSCVLGGIPAAQASSLSGLANLRSLAHQAIPYQTAQTNGKPTVMEFYADWCSSCQSLAAPMLALEQDYGDRVNFVLLDIDDPQWAAQVAAYEVTGIPHLVFVDRDRHVQRQVVGVVPKAILTNLIEQL